MTDHVPGAPIGVIGQYNLLERLEPAGPGDLFRARDTRKGRTVAVRVLPPDFITLDERTRFIDRARAMSALMARSPRRTPAAASRSSRGALALLT